MTDSNEVEPNTDSSAEEEALPAGVGTTLQIFGAFFGIGMSIAAGATLLRVSRGEEPLSLDMLAVTCGILAIALGLLWVGHKVRKPPGVGLSKLAFWVFNGLGLIMVTAGVATMLFGNLEGGWLAAFGAAFMAVSRVGKLIGSGPNGTRAVSVSEFTSSGSGFHGGTADHSSKTMIFVDQHATAEEEAAAVAAYHHEWVAKRPDWVSGQIKGFGMGNTARAWIFTGVVAVITAGLLGAALIWGDVMWLPALGASVLLGILLIESIKTQRRTASFTEGIFHAETCPAILGDRLSGEIQTGVARLDAPSLIFEINLACINSRVVEHSDNDNATTQTLSNVLWETTAKVPGSISKQRPDRLAVKVNFPLPENQPCSTPPSKSRILWRLNVTAKPQGKSYDLSFEIPVLPPTALKPVVNDTIATYTTSKP